MSHTAAPPIMLRMTSAKRLVLAGRAAPASRGRDGDAVRRYRLARMKVQGRAHADAVRASGVPGPPRHLRLERIHD
jgi:hypothetical protein